MSRRIRLNRMESVLTDVSYPATPADVAAECEDVTLVLAEGEADLGEVIRKSHADRFTSAEDVETEVMNLLPRNAVGEPYQSEGDA